MAAVRPLWESLRPHERETLLTVSLEELREYANVVAARAKAQAEAETAEHLAAGRVVLALEPPLDETLEVGLQRSQERGTWKMWRWPPENAEFHDSEVFRKYFEEKIVPERLQAAIPKDPEGSKPVESAAEAGLRQRMTELLSRINEQRNSAEETAFSRRIVSHGPKRYDPHLAMRDAHVEMIATMLDALKQEHEALYHHCLLPVTSCICELLMETSRRSTRTELAFDDFESLLPDEVARIFEWLVEKIDGLTTKLKIEASELETLDEEEDDPIGDVDLFSLIDDGKALEVNRKWLEHLQSRILGEDGQPRRSTLKEDPHQMGLVLEWVYGTIVSTAEKARDAAHRVLGTKPPDAERAAESFISALEEQSITEAQAKASRDLLGKLLENRKQTFEQEKKLNLFSRFAFNTRNSVGDDAPSTAATNSQETDAVKDIVNDDDLPNEAIIFMLKREVLLTAAKLHFLALEQLFVQRKAHSLKEQLQQGEPRFERLKRELEELKSSSNGRSSEGVHRHALESERQRMHMADATLEEQIKVQSALREKSVELQKILEERRECDVSLSRREKEIASLSKWKFSIEKLLSQFEAAQGSLKVSGIDGSAIDYSRKSSNGRASDVVLDEESGTVTEHQRALMASMQLKEREGSNVTELRKHFIKDVRRQLYSLADDKKIFDDLKRQVRELEHQIEAGKVALQHLESFAINVACDDPGISIGALLLLPFLQDRLDARALEFAAEKAAAAEDEILRMEIKSADRERTERERKARAKSKMKEKLRLERERERAEAEAKQREAEEKRRAAEEAARQAEAEARRRRVQQLEAQRKAEEELIARRRKELLEQEAMWETVQEPQEHAAPTYFKEAQVDCEEDEEGATSDVQISLTAPTQTDIKCNGLSDTTESNRQSDIIQPDPKDSADRPSVGVEDDVGDSLCHAKKGTTETSAEVISRGSDSFERSVISQRSVTSAASDVKKCKEASNKAAGDVSEGQALDGRGRGPARLVDADPNGPPTPPSVPMGPHASVKRVSESGTPFQEDMEPSAGHQTGGSMQQARYSESASLPAGPHGVQPMSRAIFSKEGGNEAPYEQQYVGVCPPMPMSGQGSVLPTYHPGPYLPPFAASGMPPAHMFPQSVHHQHPQMMYLNPGHHGVSPMAPPSPLMLDGSGRMTVCPDTGGIRPPGPSMMPAHSQGGYSTSLHRNEAMAFARTQHVPSQQHQQGPMPGVASPGLNHFVPSGPPPGSVVMPMQCGHNTVALSECNRSTSQENLGSKPKRRDQSSNLGGGKSSGRGLSITAAPFVPSSVISTSPAEQCGRDNDSKTRQCDEGPQASSEKSLEHRGSGGGSPRGILESSTLQRSLLAEERALSSKSASSDASARTSEIAEDGLQTLVPETSETSASLKYPGQVARSSTTSADDSMRSVMPQVKDEIAHVGGRQNRRKPLLAPSYVNAMAHSETFSDTSSKSEEKTVVDIRCRLTLTQGLVNAPGLYNCFLNVIIQCLWHLKSVRSAILENRSLKRKPIPDSGKGPMHLPSSCHSGVTKPLNSALHDVFGALNARSQSLKLESCDHRAGDIENERPLVSVTPLREALSTSTNARRFDLSEMHDAAEVLTEILERLHVEEAGYNRPDPTLPKRVRVPASYLALEHTGDQRSGKLQKPRAEYSSLGREGSEEPSEQGTRTVWGDTAALENVKKSLKSDISKDGKSVVQRLFGIEVQVPSGSSERCVVSVLRCLGFWSLFRGKGRGTYDCCCFSCMRVHVCAKSDWC